MTNPYARPDEPERQQPWAAPQDETIPLVPEGGYSTRPTAWTEGYEQTSVDPLAQPGYTNPSFGGQPAAQPQPAQPQPPYLPPAATYEQPPAAGYNNPYAMTTEPSPTPLLPAYPAGYPYQVPPQLPEHPNAVPA
ncbi:MAG: hypothetical protein REI45_02620, partial [Propionicimonas sp.]|nr:hypothetical protein [Propionicimonas sp.]